MDCARTTWCGWIAETWRPTSGLISRDMMVRQKCKSSPLGGGKTSWAWTSCCSRFVVLTVAIWFWAWCATFLEGTQRHISNVKIIKAVCYLDVKQYNLLHAGCLTVSNSKTCSEPKHCPTRSMSPISGGVYWSCAASAFWLLKVSRSPEIVKKPLRF